MPASCEHARQYKVANDVDEPDRIGLNGGRRGRLAKTTEIRNNDIVTCGCQRANLVAPPIPKLDTSQHSSVVVEAYVGPAVAQHNRRIFRIAFRHKVLQQFISQATTLTLSLRTHADPIYSGIVVLERVRGAHRRPLVPHRHDPGVVCRLRTCLQFAVHMGAGDMSGAERSSRFFVQRLVPLIEQVRVGIALLLLFALTLEKIRPQLKKKPALDVDEVVSTLRATYPHLARQKVLSLRRLVDQAVKIVPPEGSTPAKRAHDSDRYADYSCVLIADAQAAMLAAARPRAIRTRMTTKTSLPLRYPRKLLRPRRFAIWRCRTPTC